MIQINQFGNNLALIYKYERCSFRGFEFRTKGVPINMMIERRVEDYLSNLYLMTKLLCFMFVIGQK